MAIMGQAAVYERQLIVAMPSNLNDEIPTARVQDVVLEWFSRC